jgi:phosphoribosylglycinamide formyltransferase-1
LDTHARVLAAGDTHHGSTVHFVTEELDGGPGILAGRIAVEPDESKAELKKLLSRMATPGWMGES